MAERSLPQVNAIDQPFWRAAAAGRLVLQRCRECGKLQFFPRPACVGCFSNELEWVESSGRGTVHSYSWVWVPRNPAFKEETPICYADIVLEERVLMQSRVVGASTEKVRVGARVKVAFQKTSNPEIRLPVFELAD